MSDKQSFFSELKRRNVLRAAAFYAASAWLLVQVATQVFPFFHIAEWVVRWIVVGAAIGFPFAMLFSWFYEWTPQGLQLESEIPPNESITSHTGKKLDRWIIAILALAVVLLLADKFVLHKDTETATALGVPDKSIAVLPFDNLSGEKGNAYFAEGIQDEILTRLAKVADLKVISRTSTQRFKSAPENLPEIAKKLGVIHILRSPELALGLTPEQIDGRHVDVKPGRRGLEFDRFAQSSLGNVQLINAVTDAHLWAEIYDRKLTDLFIVESEVAKTIADTLRAKLTGSEMTAMSSQPTEDPVAHDSFVQGRHFLALRRDDNLPRAIEFFRQAIARDPNYAAAYAGLSEALILLPRLYRRLPQRNSSAIQGRRA